MSVFLPTPCSIFEAAATASGIDKDILRDMDNSSEDVVRTREMAFLLARLWTPCTPQQISKNMGLYVPDDSVIQGISEAAKSLFYNVEEVREAIMFYEEEPFKYMDRSHKDVMLATGICKIFNKVPESTYVILRHGPLADPQLLIIRGLLKIDESMGHGVRINLAEGAIMQLNGEHPFMRV